MTFLYSVKPMQCNDCEALFEPHIGSRLYLWFLVITVFSFSLHTELAEEYIGKSAMQWMVVFLVVSIVVFPVVGLIIEKFHPWQYTLCKGSHLKRKIINYGLELSMLAYGVYFFSQIV